jgi:hypothetical protein
MDTRADPQFAELRVRPTGTVLRGGGEISGHRARAADCALGG